MTELKTECGFVCVCVLTQLSFLAFYPVCELVLALPLARSLCHLAFLGLHVTQLFIQYPNLGYNSSLASNKLGFGGPTYVFMVF